MNHIEINETIAKALLPKREINGHKGTFGRAFAYIGSGKYPGAAHLATEAMLRGGCGYTEVASEADVISGLLAKFPEVIYTALPATEALTEREINLLAEKSSAADATLIGSGSGCTEALALLTIKLTALDTNKPIILDADALNAISRYGNTDSILHSAKRPVILTPHEMEFSRISKQCLDEIKADRVKVAEDFAKKYACTLVLKGYGTVITNGIKTYINPTGSTALSKGGSGDALAGLMTSLIASSNMPIIDIAALACYIHGLAGDRLSDVFSKFGVTPSDLPKEMAKIIRSIQD